MEDFIRISIIVLIILSIISVLIVSKYPNEQYNLIFNLITVLLIMAVIVICIVSIGGLMGLELCIWSGAACFGALISTIINTLINYLLQKKNNIEPI